MRFRVLAAVCLAAFVAVTLSCGKEGSSKEILVGEYGSLTGGIATFGISTRDGSQLAFDDINAEGGVLGKKIKLIVEDDQSKPEEAGTVVTKLIHQDRVVAMLGEVASSRSLAAAPICQADKIPMISPSSTNPRVTQVGDYIFRVCFIDPFQGAVMAKFAFDTLKVKKVAILVRRARATTRWGSRRSSARPSRSSAARSSREQSLQRGRLGLPGPAHGDQGRRSPRPSTCPATTPRSGRSPARRGSSASRCPSWAATAGIRRSCCEIGGEALERLLLLEPLRRRRPEPGRPEVRQRLQGQVQPASGRPRRPRPTTRPASWRTR